MEYKFPLPKEPFKNREDEISHLRKLIAEKEKNLENIGLKKDFLTPAKEAVTEYKTAPTTSALHPEYEIKKEEIDKIVLKLSPEEHDKQILSNKTMEIIGNMEITHFFYYRESVFDALFFGQIYQFIYLFVVLFGRKFEYDFVYFFFFYFIFRMER